MIVRRAPTSRRPVVLVRSRRGHAPPGLPHRHPHGEGSLRHLEVRHRARARVEDRIRCGKNTGLDRLPSRHFAINAAWLELTLTVVDLLAWTQVLLLDGELASTEPKKLRYLVLARRARA
ncbi:transposase [Streptomyces hayashii]